MADNISLTRMRKIKQQVEGQVGDQVTSSRSELSRQKPRYRNIVHLWEFLLELLAYGHQSSSIIAWNRKEHRQFVLKNPEEVAKLWGAYKNVPEMTYAKLSRALRHYYKKGIIKKVAGLRLCYQFGNLPYKYEPGVTRSRYHGYRLNECIQKQLRTKEFASFQSVVRGCHVSSACVPISYPLGKRCCCQTPRLAPPCSMMWFSDPLHSLSPFPEVMFPTRVDSMKPFLLPSSHSPF